MSSITSKKSVFSERVAYARWVRQLRTRGAETDRELAELSGLGYDWVHKWKQRPDAPVERLMSRALARYLLVDEDWLLDGEGEPPRPELWADWIVAHRAEPQPAPRAAIGPNVPVTRYPPHQIIEEAATPKKKAANKRRGR